VGPPAPPPGAGGAPRAPPRPPPPPPSSQGAITAVTAAVPTELLMGGGGNGAGAGGGGGGGGGGPWGFLSRALAARADELSEDEDDVEEEEEYEEGSEEEYEDDEEGDGVDYDNAVSKGGDDEELSGGDFFCAQVSATGLPREEGVPTEEELFANLKCQPGFRCSRAELSEDLRTLMGLGLFEDVTANVEPIPGTNKSKLVVRFDQKIWPRMTSFRVDGASILPQEVVDKVMEEHSKTEGPSNMRTLALIKNVVEKWYQDRGYPFCYISTYDGMDSGSVVANLVEGRISTVNLVFQDEAGNTIKGGGQTDPNIVTRELPFREGMLYSQDDARRALRDIFATNLFDNVQVAPRQSSRDEKEVEVDVLLRERPAKSAEVEMEWQFQPNERGLPAVVSLVPGGSISFEHRNLQGIGNQISASINTQNFLRPQEDLGFKVEYKVPFLRGSADPNRTNLGVTAFNARKMCPAFTTGPGMDPQEMGVQQVWVDRTGAKISINEQYNRNSKGQLSLVVQEVATCDDQGQQIANIGRGRRGMGGGAEGPATTHSPTGKDRTAFIQGNVVRDATYFVNGALVGPRDIFKMEQGLGVGGLPFFNRCEASLSRFVQVLPVRKGSKAMPPTVVLHAKAGHTVGDLPGYDLHPLGGPYSVRGYTIGELASARTFAELAAEVRVQIPTTRHQAYGFFEHGTDLGSADSVKGNPTQFLKKAGSGSSYGVGVKFGAVRAEWAKDCNLGRGAWYMKFGERF